MRGVDADLPQFGQEWESPVFRWWRLRWFRYAVLSVASLLVLSTVWYQVFVVPELTATEFQIWRVGGERATVLVDKATDRVHVTNGGGGLSEFFVADGALLVLAAEVDAGRSAQAWVRVPLNALDDAFMALAADRVPPGVSVAVKDCEAMLEDTAVLAAVTLGTSSLPAREDGRIFVCGDAHENLSNGLDLLVRSEAIRPGKVGDLPDEIEIVDVGLLEDPAVVIAALEALAGRPAQEVSPHRSTSATAPSSPSRDEIYYTGGNGVPHGVDSYTEVYAG